MPSEHARLSPSSATRWLSCPASLRLAEEVPREPESEYAAEGTAAHELCEIEASYVFGHLTSEQYQDRLTEWSGAAFLEGYDIEEMEEHAAAYVALLEERAALYPNSQVLLEQRMPTGLPESFGTSDAVIVSPQHVEIVDFKYGKGVPVSAVRNPQLRLYGCGALDTFGDLLGETEVVRTTVHQPRLHSVSTEELTPGELRAWRDYVRPIAEEALEGSSRFGPSEEACRWCPVAGTCRARMERMAALDFGTDPDLLSPAELAEQWQRLSEVRDWASAVEAAALDQAYSKGVELPGLKVVMSGGSRRITDHDAAVEKLVAAGYDRAEVTNVKAKGIGDLEKLLRKRKQKLADVLGDLVTKGPGRPSLAPADDTRPVADRYAEAVQDFS